jgi:uncharacterized protein DUF6580
MRTPRLSALILLILAAAATRLLPHPPNLTSVTAIALFGGAYFGSLWLAFAVPLLALLGSDLILGFYPGMEVQYLSFALIICIGLTLRRRRSFARITAAALASAVSFFVLSNFGVWALGTIYPRTLAGLETCFVAAIPFFRNMLVGDLFYTVVLFGGFYLLEQRFNELREQPLALARAPLSASK